MVAKPDKIRDNFDHDMKCASVEDWVRWIIPGEVANFRRMSPLDMVISPLPLSRLTSLAGHESVSVID